ncbi:AraC family transcriptional regulator [Pedobacter nototheniae]|uniref:AraC family transcriptional regulator n=1 Tax=Pedobacter nototheniae TaxID=2488994 RepID=UPI00293028F8|nr:AraC family transcriptional regulator [Pedobacter nototheniae]
MEMNISTNTNLYCVYNVLNFIENNYDQYISIKELEEVSNYSYRNIQRIFKYTCGETIGAYQQRLKVENGYKLIIYTKSTLTAIALQVGFANLASFSKAFKLHFKISPKMARLNKPSLFLESRLIPVISEEEIKPEIIYLKPLKIYYESTQTSYINADIELLWDHFMKHKFPDHDTEYFGVIADEPLIKTQLSYRYDACASAASKSIKLPSKSIFGGRYAQFIHQGRYETIENTYTKIYAGWILNSGLEFAHTPIIEKYIKHIDNTNHIDEQLTAILLPLQ